jgi:RimJ/RimL family protein N-acetyltransferase
MKDLLKGRRIRLSAADPEELTKAYSTWNRDSEFNRLLDARPLRWFSAKASKEALEKEFAREADALFLFTIRDLEDDRLLGDVGLEVTEWNAGDAYVGIGIGDRELWGRGYGTEAMNLALGFAFTELNLRRVTLTVFEYNPRAVRSYEKAGFRHEGRKRQALCREGKRWDEIYMGILREEWLAVNGLKNGSFDNLSTSKRTKTDWTG